MYNVHGISVFSKDYLLKNFFYLGLCCSHFVASQIFNITDVRSNCSTVTFTALVDGRGSSTLSFGWLARPVNESDVSMV